MTKKTHIVNNYSLSAYAGMEGGQDQSRWNTSVQVCYYQKKVI